MFEDLSSNPARFRFRVVSLVITDAPAARIRSPKGLAFALPVVLHHRSGNVEDRLRRAIVLFEPDDLRSREVNLEVEDVADVRATPLVDRLVFVANHGNVL